MAIHDNVQGFAADLDAFSRAVKVQTEAAVRMVVLELLKRIVLRTPKDTGRAQNSWMVAKGSPNNKVAPEGHYEGPHIDVSNISFDPPEGVYWIWNNLPYIEVLEFGLYPNPTKSKTGKTSGGFSVQAPQGMVRISIAELGEEIAQIIRNAA